MPHMHPLRLVGTDNPAQLAGFVVDGRQDGVCYIFRRRQFDGVFRTEDSHPLVYIGFVFRWHDGEDWRIGLRLLDQTSGWHETRFDQLEDDVLGRQLEPEGLGQIVKGRLARVVDPHQRLRHNRGGGGQVHDTSAAVLSKMRDGHSHDFDRAEEVGFEHASRCFVRCRFEDREQADAGDVDDGVYAPEAGHAGIEGGSDRCRIGHIECVREQTIRRPAVPVTRVSHGGYDIPSAIMELRRGSFAEAGRAAGYENCPGHVGTFRWKQVTPSVCRTARMIYSWKCRINYRSSRWGSSRWIR